jgi:23S rRNA (uracil1939-C5)-methyltransferase
MKPQTAPPRKNTVLTLTVESVNAKGFGIARVDGFVLLIENALPGEHIEARVIKVKTRYGYGKIQKILLPSPHRHEPLCAVSGTCGGCQFSHCNYPEQLRIKKQIVVDALERIGGVSSPPVGDVLGMGDGSQLDSCLRYRNKAVFPVVPVDSHFAVGMYAPRSHRIVEFDDCLLQHRVHVPVIAVIKEYMRLHNIPAYNETTHTGTMRQIIIRTSRATGEVMVVLVVNADRLPGETAFASALIEQAGVTTVIFNAHTARTNAVVGTRFRTMRGTGYIEEKIGNVRYKISAPSFFQVNTVQAKVLYDTALEMIGDTLFLLDAHAGTGGIALYAAANSRLPHMKITGIDIFAPAIDDAKKNAVLNGITNAHFVTGAAEELIPQMLSNVDGGNPQAVVLDPPRRGCDTALLDALINARIPKIVYVSCDPATFARDVKYLCAGGYVLERVQPIDMFPLTGHVEVVALLCRTVRVVIDMECGNTRE